YVFQRIAAALRRADRAMMFAEVPLLYESGFNVFCHKVIVVKAAPEVILERLCRKGFSAAEVGSRNAAQKSLQEKAERADFVIDNSGGLEETQRQTQSVLNSLRAELKGAK
ncbi:MAG: dephospho-CoA kinase, partial [Candidatus Omnitrophota bacterium]